MDLIELEQQVGALQSHCPLSNLITCYLITCSLLLKSVLFAVLFSFNSSNPAGGDWRGLKRDGGYDSDPDKGKKKKKKKGKKRKKKKRKKKLTRMEMHERNERLELERIAKEIAAEKQAVIDRKLELERRRKAALIARLRNSKGAVEIPGLFKCVNGEPFISSTVNLEGMLERGDILRVATKRGVVALNPDVACYDEKHQRLFLEAPWSHDDCDKVKAFKMPVGFSRLPSDFQPPPTPVLDMPFSEVTIAKRRLREKPFETNFRIR